MSLIATLSELLDRNLPKAKSPFDNLKCYYGLVLLLKILYCDSWGKMCYRNEVPQSRQEVILYTLDIAGCLLSLSCCSLEALERGVPNEPTNTLRVLLLSP